MHSIARQKPSVRYVTKGDIIAESNAYAASLDIENDLTFSALSNSSYRVNENSVFRRRRRRRRRRRGNSGSDNSIETIIVSMLVLNIQNTITIC